MATVIDGSKVDANSIELNGSTSGAVTIQAPAVAGTTTVTLPDASGVLVTTGSGAWELLGSHTFVPTETQYILSSIPNQYAEYLITGTDIVGASGAADSRLRFDLSGNNGSTVYASADASPNFRVVYMSGVIQLVVAPFSSNTNGLAGLWHSSWVLSSGSQGNVTDTAFYVASSGGALNYIRVFDKNSVGIDAGTIKIYGRGVNL